MEKNKNVLITGAYSGIGNELLKIYLNNNFNVYAFDIKEIKEQNKCLKSYLVDIRDINKLSKIKDNLELLNIKFDLIINVAGIHKMVSLVEDDVNKMKELIDINLNGPMNINNIFYPLLNEFGKIIIITSEVANLSPMPFNGLYNISKTALDCYSQALRQELNLLNQKVITIRPGAIKTDLQNNSINETINLANNTKLYIKQAKNFYKIMLKFMGQPIDPSILANKIYNIGNKKNPKYNYHINRNLGLVLLDLLPLKVQCFIIKKILNK